MSSSDTKKPKFSVAITTTGYQKLINNTLGDPDRARKFVSSITSAVAVNPALQECEASSILAGALLGESLGLQPSPQLGQYYLIPFNVKQKVDPKTKVTIAPACKKAQFVLGYKGYIQLALRTGQYKKLNVIEIKEGELRSFDYLNEEIECVMIDDFEAREKAETIGYYAMFEYMNGFRKAMYWTKDQMMRYADKYSRAFSSNVYMRILNGEIDADSGNYSSFWYKNFDDMAKKTMLRQIISKWGIMSAELVSAIEHDNKFMQNQGANIVEEDIEEPTLDQTYDMPQEIIDEAPAEPKNISFDDL